MRLELPLGTRSSSEERWSRGPRIRHHGVRTAEPSDWSGGPARRASGDPLRRHYRNTPLPAQMDRVWPRRSPPVQALYLRVDDSRGSSPATFGRPFQGRPSSFGGLGCTPTAKAPNKIANAWSSVVIENL